MCKQYLLYSSEKIKEKTHLSQTVFAALLNVQSFFGYKMEASKKSSDRWNNRVTGAAGSIPVSSCL